MIRVKTIVEITDEYDRENMDKYFQKMTIKDLRNFCLSANSELENKLKDELKAALGPQIKVHIKDVEVTEE